MISILVTFFSYLIGSISGSFILGKFSKGIDIRKYGSGNAGTTNAMRVMGKKMGVLTFFIDFLKGIITLLIVKYFFGEEFLLLSALFCILGHDFPFYMSFKGGKGIATTIGAMAVINFYLTLISVIIGILIAFFSKIVSLGSISFLLLLALLFTLYADYNLYSLAYIYTIAILGIIRHKSNIKRLINGTENIIGR